MIRRLVVVLIVITVAAREPLVWAAGRDSPDDRADRVQQGSDPEVMARFLRSVPIGSALRLRTIEGQRARVVLMAVDPDAIVVQRRSRRPEPPYRVPFASVASAEIDKGRSSLGAAIGIGVLAGAATFVTMLVILVASIED